MSFKITAAANTGPAKHPRPTSSTPAILVILVLIQKSEGGALGIGVSQDSFMFSRTAGNFLTKATPSSVFKLHVRLFLPELNCIK